MDEDLDVEVQDLATDEIQELLVEAGTDVSPEQAQQLAQFVREAGGLDEALALLAELTRQSRAA